MTTPPRADPSVPTGDDVRALAARLVTDELVIVPVRHHSPACAAAVEAAFARYRPSRVLVEGPRSFTALVDLLCHPEAEMPLAVYAWSRPAGPASAGAPSADASSAGASTRATAADRHGGYYPFCDHSPELVALRCAHAAGVPAAFCDLEVAEQAAAASDEVLPGDGSLLREGAYEHSRALAALAQRLGCRDEEDLWELLVEAGPDDLDTHLAALTAYCLLARRDQTDAELAADGTLAREAEMAWHVRGALDARRHGDGPVMVVVGGFHAVALPDLLAGPPVPRPALEVGDVDGGAALVRYGFERLDRLNGYASGMTSPGWHQRLWDLRRRTSATVGVLTERSGVSDDRAVVAGTVDARTAATLDVLLDLATELRRDAHALPVATPSVVAAQTQAVLLARLREHPGPLRTDVVDAVTSCLVQGDADVEGRRVHAALRRVLTGTRVGRVPPGAGTPPLVRDALEQLAALRLDTDGTQPRQVALDLYRIPAHRRTSRVLHGLRLLGVPFATHDAGPDFVRGTGLARLQERWTCWWSPETEGRLAELSLLGSTLAEAVDTRFGLHLEDATADGRVPAAGQAVALLAQAAVTGLHERCGPVVDLVRTSLAAEPSFVGAAHAAGSLALLDEGREPLDAARLTGLPDLVATAYARALYLGRDVSVESPSGSGAPASAAPGGPSSTSAAPGGRSSPVQGAEDVAAALSRLRELVASPGRADLDDAPYWSLVDGLRRDHAHPLVRGAAAGLSASAGRLPADDLARDVAGHLASSIPAVDAVGFVRGLLSTSRESLWQDTGLVAALDARFRTWDTSAFFGALPELRLAFAALTPRETDRVAALVAGLHGGERPDVSVHHDVGDETVRRHVRLSEHLGDVLVRDGLGAWLELAGDRS